MKVSLIAATPGEHASGAPASASRDFAFESYNYAIGLLACGPVIDRLGSRSTAVDGTWATGMAGRHEYCI